MSYGYSYGSGLPLPADVLETGSGSVEGHRYARRLTGHSVLSPFCAEVDYDDREMVMTKALFLSQFLRLFMLIDGIFLVLWSLIAWPFILGLLLIIMGFYGVKYYNIPLAAMYGVYLMANIALRIWWLTLATSVFDIVIISLGLAIVAYIFMLLCSFIHTLSCLTDPEILLLRAYSNWDFGYYTPVVIMPVIVSAPIAASAPGGAAGGGYYQQPTEGLAGPARGSSAAAYPPYGYQGYQPPQSTGAPSANSGKQAATANASTMSVPSVSSSPSTSSTTSSPEADVPANRVGSRSSASINTDTERRGRVV